MEFKIGAQRDKVLGLQLRLDEKDQELDHTVDHIRLSLTAHEKERAHWLHERRCLQELLQQRERQAMALEARLKQQASADDRLANSYLEEVRSLRGELQVVQQEKEKLEAAMDAERGNLHGRMHELQTDNRELTARLERNLSRSQRPGQPEEEEDGTRGPGKAEEKGRRYHELLSDLQAKEEALTAAQSRADELETLLAGRREEEDGRMKEKLAKMAHQCRVFKETVRTLEQELQQSQDARADIQHEMDEVRLHVAKLMAFQTSASQQLLEKDAQIEELAETAEAKEEEMCRLSLTLQNRQEEVEQLAAKLDMTDMERERFSSELDCRDEEIAQLTEKVDVKEEEISRLSEKLEVKDEEIAQLVDKVETKDEEISRLTEKLDRKNEEVSRLLEKLNLKEEEIAGLTEEEEAKKEQIARLSEKLNLKEEEIAQLSEKLNLKEEEMARLTEKEDVKEEIAWLMARELEDGITPRLQEEKLVRGGHSGEVERSADSRETGASEAKEEIGRLREKLSAKEEKVALLIEQLASKEDEMDELAWQLTAKEEQLSYVASKDREIAQLNSAVAAKDEEVANLASLVAAKEQEIARLSASSADEKLSQLALLVAAKDERISEMTTRMNATEEELSELTSSITSKDVEMSELTSSKEAAISQLQGEVAEKEEEISRLTCVLSSKDEQLSHLHELSTLLTAKDEELSQLATSVSDRDEEISQLTSLLTAKEAEISELVAAAAGQDEEIARLTSVVKTKEEEIRELRSVPVEDETATRIEEISHLTSLVTAKDEEMSQMSSLMRERDTEISQLNSTLASQDREMSELTSLVSIKEEEISQLNSLVNAKDEELSQRDSRIAVKDAEICELRASVDVVEESTLTTAVVEEKDEEISHLNVLLTSKDAEISQLDSSLTAKDAEMAELVSLASTKDEEISQLNVLANAKDGELSRLNSEIALKDGEIAELKSLVSAKEESIVPTVSIIEKDEEIAHLKALLTSKDAEISQLTSLLTAKEEEMAEELGDWSTKEEILPLTSTPLTKPVTVDAATEVVHQPWDCAVQTEGHTPPPTGLETSLSEAQDMNFELMSIVREKEEDISALRAQLSALRPAHEEREARHEMMTWLQRELQPRTDDQVTQTDPAPAPPSDWDADEELDLHAQLTDAHCRQQELEAQVSGLEWRLAEAEEAAREAAELRQALDEVRAELESPEEAAALRQALDEARTELGTLRQHLEQSNEEFLNQREALQCGAEERRHLESQVGQLNEQVEEMLHFNKAVNNELRQAREASADTSDEDALRQELQAALQAAHDKHLRVQTLQTQVSKLSRENRHLQLQVHSLQRRGQLLGTANASSASEASSRESESTSESTDGPAQVGVTPTVIPTSQEEMTELLRSKDEEIEDLSRRLFLATDQLIHLRNFMSRHASAVTQEHMRADTDHETTDTEPPAEFTAVELDDAENLRIPMEGRPLLSRSQFSFPRRLMQCLRLRRLLFRSQPRLSPRVLTGYFVFLHLLILYLIMV